MLGFVSLFLNSRQAGLLLAAFLLAAFIGVKRLGYDEFALLRRGVVLKVYDAPVVRSALFAVFFDLGLVGLSYYVARGLKRDVWAVNAPSAWGLTLIALLAFATVASLWLFGLYRGTWRLASLDDVVRCGAAVLVASAFVWVVSPKFLEERAGASQLAVFALVAAALVCGTRVSYRLLQDRAWKASTEGQPVLIYGAGNAGMAALRELQRNPERGMKPVGFLDDDPHLKGKTISGCPSSDLSRASRRLSSGRARSESRFRRRRSPPRGWSASASSRGAAPSRSTGSRSGSTRDAPANRRTRFRSRHPEPDGPRQSQAGADGYTRRGVERPDRTALSAERRGFCRRAVVVAGLAISAALVDASSISSLLPRVVREPGSRERHGVGPGPLGLSS